MSPMSFDYRQLGQAMIQAGVNTSVSEAHGVICAALSAPSPDMPDWFPLIRGVIQPDAGVRMKDLDALLGDLWRESRSSLEDEAFGFQLLLPDSDVALAERVEALGDWCRGYLLGLARMGITAHGNHPGDVAEILNDITRIAEAEPGAEDAEEVQEKSFMELEEYLRVAVQLVYSELQVAGRDTTAESG